MRIHRGSVWKSEGDSADPTDWLESVQKIRNRLVVMEGLLSSLILEEPPDGRDRISKALESAVEILATVDDLTDSIKESVNLGSEPLEGGE